MTFTSREFQILRTFVFGQTQNLRDVQEDQMHTEIMSVSFTIHKEGVHDPNYFHNGTVREEDYSKLLNTYVRNEK